MYWNNTKFRMNIAVFGLLIAANLLMGCSDDVSYTPPAGNSEMAIRHYSFGKMVIDGKTYEHDLCIAADKTVKNWQMHLNHYIELCDIRDWMGDDTRTLIIGIGAQNGCSVADDVVAYMQSKGIELIILNTYDAVRRFNALPKKGLAACFHLNC